MNPRLALDRVAPDHLHAVLGLEEHVRQHVPTRLLELVKLRASYLNGCSYCIDMHTRALVDTGMHAHEVTSVVAWTESPWLDADERAALALTDAVTRLGTDGVDDHTWDEAVAHLGERRTADLLLAIATINVWNRLMVATRTPPPVAAPA